MVPEVIILALLVGIIAKGKFGRLADVQIKYIWLLFVVLALAVGMRKLVHMGVLTYPSMICSVIKISEFVILIALALANLRMAGVKLMLVGFIANLAAIVANGGIMPVSPSGMALTAGTHLAEYMVKYPFVKDMLIGPNTRLVFLCDIYTAVWPYALISSIYSIGDFITSIGGFIAIIAIMRTPLPSELKKSAVNEA